MRFLVTYLTTWSPLQSADNISRVDVAVWLKNYTRDLWVRLKDWCVQPSDKPLEIHAWVSVHKKKKSRSLQHWYSFKVFKQLHSFIACRQNWLSSFKVLTLFHQSGVTVDFRPWQKGRCQRWDWHINYSVWCDDSRNVCKKKSIWLSEWLDPLTPAALTCDHSLDK